MALLLNEIEWGEPLLPIQLDPDWEAEIKRRNGHVSEVDRRVAPSHWLREAALDLMTYQPVAISQRLFDMGAMVTAQENACRYCYGATRANLKIRGYTEDFIHRMERDVHMAELDAKERAAIAFCRNLARSRPRPSREACDDLVRLGYSRQAVHEMAFVISMGCFYNRVSTFIACPPEQGFERMANGPLGRLIGIAAPLLRRISRSSRPGESAPMDVSMLLASPFGTILLPLAGLPAARMMHDALEGAFASEVFGHATKALMFAVVARTLGCVPCETHATGLLTRDGMGPSEIEAALANLRSDRLPGAQAGLLPWVRGTVYYETAAIQRATRELGAGIGERAVLEAIGIAALANATVRLAMLHA